MDSRAHAELRRRALEAQSTVAGAGREGSPDADVARHLLDCADCREAVAHRREVVARLRAMPRASAPAGLADRIFAASERRVARVGRPVPRRRILRYAAIGASLAAAVTVAVLLGRRDRIDGMEIRFEERPLEKMVADSPFSSAVFGKAIRIVKG